MTEGLRDKVFLLVVSTTAQGVSPLRTENDKYVESDEQKAQALNDFFSTVFTREDTSTVLNMSTEINSKNSLLNEIVLTPLTVEAKLKGLNESKIQGTDGIPPKVLKELSKEISVPLCISFNKSLETGIIPNDWKSAEVVALFKKGSRSEPSNYRPVSLTSVICKVLESLIRDVLVEFMADNKFFSTCQHGFANKDHVLYNYWK